MSLTSNKKRLTNLIKTIIWVCPLVAIFSAEPIKIFLAGGYLYFTAKYLGFLGRGSVIGSEIGEL